MRSAQWTTAFLVALTMVSPAFAGGPSESSATTEKPYGLPPRKPLLTSNLYGAPEPPLPFRAAPAFAEKTFNQPVYLLAEPGTKRLLVADYTGKIVAFDDPALSDDPKKAAENIKPDVLLQRSGRMFYSFAFHPKYLENRYLFLFSNGALEGQGPLRKNRLSRFTMTPTTPAVLDPKSELIVIEWTSNGHDGGDLGFGKDGFVYMTAGDGTVDSDTNVTGQDISDLNSGLLRLDVDKPEPGKNYAIPPDNPFLKVPNARPELWAFGFRNPWRLHIDPRGNIWCGDVGQDLWEMIEVVQRGDNYGWSVWEGGHPFYLERKIGPAPLKAPAIAHPHSEARSITGGVTYLGKKFPELYGHYVYADYATGKMWACQYDNGKIINHREIADTPNQISTFGIDHTGEIFFADYGVNKFFTLERTPKETIPHEFPRKLSETGLFASVTNHRIRPELIPYSVNSPLWSDGAYKERYIALPGTSKIDFDEKGAWKFPERGVLVKSFALDREQGNPATRTWVETRFMLFQQKEWIGYSYRWNDEQTEAYLVGSAGDDRAFTIRDSSAPGGQRTQNWHFPSRAECMVCHSRAGGFILGPQTLQMNKLHDYGGVVDNQIRALVHADALSIPTSEYLRITDVEVEAAGNRLLPFWEAVQTTRQKLQSSGISLPPRFARVTNIATSPIRNFWSHAAKIPRQLVRQSRERAETQTMSDLALAPSSYPALPDPLDATASLEGRVKSYLHANCAICHVDAGGGNAAMWLGYTTPLDKMRLVGETPLHDKFGIPDARIIAPGAPEKSVLLKRISMRGRGQMPPLASSQIDKEGIAVVEAWVKQLGESATPNQPTTTAETKPRAARRRRTTKAKR